MFKILIDWLYDVTTIHPKDNLDKPMERYIYTCYCIFYTTCFCNITRKKFQLLGICYLYHMGIVRDMDAFICDNNGYSKEDVEIFFNKENQLMESVRQILHTKLPPKLHILIESLNNTQTNFRQETLDTLAGQMEIYPKLQLHKMCKFKDILIGFLSCSEIYNCGINHQQQIKLPSKLSLPPKINILIESLNDEHTDFREEVLPTLSEQLEIYPKLYKEYNFMEVLMDFLSHPKMYYKRIQPSLWVTTIPAKINILLKSLNDTCTNFEQEKSETLFEELEIYPKLTKMNKIYHTYDRFKKIFIYCFSCPEIYQK